MKNQRLLQISVLICFLSVLICVTFAQENLDELKEKYFKEKKFTEFIDYLQDLKRKQEDVTIDYYLALSRYSQLKDLEERKDWEEYFNLRNLYRDRIIKETQNVVQKAEDPKICLEAKYLNWLMHKELNDEEKDIVLKELIGMASDYIKKGKDPLVLKGIAKRLEFEQEESASLNLYSLYVKALIEMSVPLEQLRQEADNTYREDNIWLSTQIYDQYIERLKKTDLSKEELSQILLSIIKNFADYGQPDVKDSDYAEKLFTKLQEISGQKIFDEEIQYLHAYNLQRKKEYLRCAEEYEILLKNYPETKFRDEVGFKLGIIYLYELEDIQKALDYLINLTNPVRNTNEFVKSKISNGVKKQYVLSSLYHLGLYYQYKGEGEKAISFYQQISDIAKDNEEFIEIIKPTKERIREIEEQRSIEYNLKTFLDAVFLESITGENIEVYGAPGKSLKKEVVGFQTKTLPLETGCLVPEFKFLWSGDLGRIEKISESLEEFVTSYLNLGTKVVNLVVLGPLQIWDKEIEMVDICD